MAENFAADAAIRHSKRASSQDVFLRLLPPEYWLMQLPSTAVQENLKAGRGNFNLDPALRELLRYETSDRDKIVPRNFVIMMHEALGWVTELAAAGDTDAGKVAELLRGACAMIAEIETARLKVILC